MLLPEKFLIVVLGPTAIGKTQLSIQLANHFQTEIISADSRQFYKEMEIGTAKPIAGELKAAKHHFINSQSIQEPFSVGDFEVQALELLNKLFEMKNVVILTGGSGLFIQAVCEGFDNIPKAAEGVRERLNNLLDTDGISVLQERLRQVDPDYFAEVDIHNPQRIIRALEVFESTGQKFSSFRLMNQASRDFKIIKIGLNMNRSDLYSRINSRVDAMIEDGLLEEVKGLLPYRELNALNTVGYTEIFDFLDGEITLEIAIEKIKQNTRKFAKRQLTWFRRQEDIAWFQPQEASKVINYITQQLTQNPEPGAQKN